MTLLWFFLPVWTCVLTNVNVIFAVFLVIQRLLYEGRFRIPFMAWQKVVFLTTVGCVLTYVGCVMQEKWIRENRVQSYYNE